MPIVSLPKEEAAAGGEEEAHASEHESGGADEISVGGLSGVLTDDQPPDPSTLGWANLAIAKADVAASDVGLGNVENFLASNLVAVSTPTVNLPDANDLILHRETLGASTSIKILAAGIAKSDGTTGTTSLELQVYNNTDTASIYSTTGINRGSYGTPLASGGTADDVEIRVSNATGAAVDCQGFCLAVIE